MKCTHCNINWAILLPDEQGDDVYHVCPQCKGDSLVESDEEAFVMGSDGVIRNYNTGEEMPRAFAIPPMPPNDPELVRQEVEFKWLKKIDNPERRELEDKIIESQY